MVDITSIVALTIAVIALLIASLQLTQQLLATGYVVRKCDRVISGGVTQGGIRTFHWRQFRFTVHYEVLTFAFPTRLYESLGVSPAVVVQNVKGKSNDIWEIANRLKPTRTSAQGSWVSFVQDMLPCLRRDWIGLRWDSGDRIPDDLTVAPAQVDMVTMMLLSVASGLQLSKYSPAAAEISMSGLAGALTSSEHPVLGGLLHYTPTIQNTRTALTLRETFAAHTKAVGHEHGVWANAVFGKFNDRSYGRGFMHFRVLRNAKLQLLTDNGWPEGSVTDTIGGAAGFMAFATVDLYEAVPPTCVRRWSAHFAEMIVKAHLKQIQGTTGLDFTSELIAARREVLEAHGGSSPFAQWDSQQVCILSKLNDDSLTAFDASKGSLEAQEKGEKESMQKYEPTNRLQPVNLANSELIHCCQSMDNDDDDPSTFVPLSAAFEVVMRCDVAMYMIRQSSHFRSFEQESLNLVAKAISHLAEAGAPSWGQAPHTTEEWPDTLEAEVAEARRGIWEFENPSPFLTMVAYAKLFILRAAYFTVMLRAAGELGPGLPEDTEPVTALAYLA
jgi:hypothetical protein